MKSSSIALKTRETAENCLTIRNLWASGTVKYSKFQAFALSAKWIGQTV